MNFLEIGSGSGVLSICLIKEASKIMKTKGLSIDIMLKGTELSKKNANLILTDQQN